jgi:hypothetical protein
MAFPVVADTNTSRTDSATVSLPPSISVGNLLLVFFATDGDNTITNWGGFTGIFSLSEGTAASLHVGYKIAVGSDTLTITTSSSDNHNKFQRDLFPCLIQNHGTQHIADAGGI